VGITATVVNGDLLRECLELYAHFIERRLREAHQVHFVHAQDQVRNTKQRGQKAVPSRLFHQPVAHVHQNHCKIRSGKAGHHIGQIAQVPGAVGQDENVACPSEK